MMSTAPTSQFTPVACPGARSATSRNGTGNHLRLRKSSAPARAVPRCSAADGAFADGGDDDIARNLTVEQTAEELADHGVERGGTLDVRQMARLSQHLDATPRDRAMQRARFFRRREDVLVPDDDQRWHVDRRAGRQGIR